MSAVVSPWGAGRVDPERALAELRGRFPSAVLWWGQATGHFWAFLADRSGGRLLEDETPGGLSSQLASARQRLASQPRASAGWWQRQRDHVERWPHG